ncbi:hypothetical protein G6F56_011724 [Rhizopus delemar]|nr:hypothetical protein G6F56_011724 [Rhizopus delemar]
MQISNNEKNQSLLNEKLCEMEEMRFEADQKRAEEMFKIEQRRFEIERLSVADERAKTQIAFAKMWKSLGLSNENIVQKINSMWA